MWSRWVDLQSGASLDPFHRYCFGGAVSGDQGGINNRSLAHCHALREDVGLDRLIDFLLQVVLLEQMPDAENRCLIRDLVADQFDAGETPHCGYLKQRILHGLITEAVPLLHQVNPEHCAQWL